jgi:glycosyl transferase family 1
VRPDGPAGRNRLGLLVIGPTAPPYHGMTKAKATAAGLPIVTTDQGVISETVLHGVNGFIVPGRDQEALSQKLLLLLRDDELRRRMGQNSRELFLKRIYARALDPEHRTGTRWRTNVTGNRLAFRPALELHRDGPK